MTYASRHTSTVVAAQMGKTVVTFAAASSGSSSASSSHGGGSLNSALSHFSLRCDCACLINPVLARLGIRNADEIKNT
jgi:hypothetical protein